VVSGVLAATGSAASTAEVTIPAKLFAPHEVTVVTGTTVTWRNSDRTTHTATQDDDAFDSGFIRPGETFSTTFSKSGSYAYHCSIHKTMRGIVSVFDVVLRGPVDPVPAGRRTILTGVAPSGVSQVELSRLLPAPAVVVGTASVGADGTFRFGVRAPEPRAYRVQAGAASSPLVRVPVEPHVLAEPRGRAIAVRAVPARPGSRVVLQEYDREHFTFVTVTRGKLDAASKASLPYAPQRPEHVRVVVRGSQGWSDGASRTLLVRP
jgi:plastocyanin